MYIYTHMDHDRSAKSGAFAKPFPPPSVWYTYKHPLAPHHSFSLDFEQLIESGTTPPMSRTIPFNIPAISSQFSPKTARTCRIVKHIEFPMSIPKVLKEL